MFQLRHVGIYVTDLHKETEFYSRVFGMHFICQDLVQEDDVIEQLLSAGNIFRRRIRITKLVTDYGKIIGNDDMIELIQIEKNSAPELLKSVNNKQIWYSGCMHIAFGVDDLQLVLSKVEQYGGTRETEIKKSENGNRWCFCRDPEGNWIELIERR